MRTAEMAERNPTAALAGQMAGSLPYFRPGLPLNTQGLATPAISGAIGGGVEAGAQLASGEEFDPGRVLLAVLGNAALGRETRLGQRIAPNLVAPAIPKSAQILAEPATKTPSIANKATEVATQTKGSPYALQNQLNQLVEQPVVSPIKSAQESAEVFQSIKPAQESAEVFEKRFAEEAAVEAAERARLSAIESRIQSLVDEISGGDQVLRTQILGRRQGMADEDFLAVLESQADFRRNPAAQPDILAAQVAEETRRAQMAAPAPLPEELGVVAGAIRQSSLDTDIGYAADRAVPPSELSAIPQARAALMGEALVGAAPGEVAALRQGLAPLDIPGQPVTVASQVAAMDAPTFRAWASQQEGGFTTTALNTGSEAASNPALLDELRAGKAQAEAEYNQAMQVAMSMPPESRLAALDVVSPLASKVQFFNEALAEAGKGLPQPRPVAPEPTALPEPAPLMTEVEQLFDPIPASQMLPQRQPRDPVAAAQASALRRQRGAVSPQVLFPAAGSLGGAAGGFTFTERQEGESDEAYLARRLANAGKGAVVGGGAGAIASSRFRPGLFNTKPPTKDPSLAKIRDTLADGEKKNRSLFEMAQDAAGNFLFRFNSRALPIETDLQKPLYRQAGKEYRSGAFYDLSDRFEDLAGAPVIAQKEAEPLYDLVRQMKPDDRARFSEYLALRRIQDRLERIPGEQARLQDAVGVAEAELEAARQAHRSQKTLGNAREVELRKKELAAAVKELNEEANRLRVADWSLDENAKHNPVKALRALQDDIGPERFSALEANAAKYQEMMRDVLRRNVESGILSQQAFDAMTGETTFYSPFKVLKYYDEGQGMLPGGGSRMSSVAPGYKKISGIDDEELKLANPLIPSYEQIYKGSIKDQKNRFLRRVATLATMDPEGEYIRLLPDDESPRKGYKSIAYYQGGQRKHFEVRESVARALEGNWGEFDKTAFMQGLTLGNALFKMGATSMNIPWAASNAAVFDPIRFGIMSKYGIKGPVDALRWAFIDYPIGLWSAARAGVGRPDELGQKWLSSGAANATFSRVFTPEAFERQLPSSRTLGKILWDSKMGLATVNNWLNRATNVLETTPKLAALRRALRQEDFENLAPAEAQRRWQEITHEIRNFAGSPDFSRMGSDMAMLNVLVPFANARWQGFIADAGRLFGPPTSRTANEARIKMAALVAAPAAVVMLRNLEPENRKDYEAIPERERLRGTHIPLYRDDKGETTPMKYRFVRPGEVVENEAAYKDTPDGPIREYLVIPKREFPMLMANATEGFVKWLETEDPQAFKGLGDSLMNVALPISFEGRNFDERVGSALAGVTPVLRTPGEYAFNIDAWRGKEIIPESRLKGSPEGMVRRDTPQAFRDLAASLPEQLPDRLRSPAMVQKIVENFTGGMTRQFINPPGKEDQTMGDRILRRFRRSDNMDYEPLLEARDEAMRGYVDQRTANSELAQGIVNELVAANDPQFTAQLLQRGAQDGTITPEVMQQINQLYKLHMRGLDREQLFLMREVPKPARAQYFVRRMMDMADEDAKAFREDAKQVGLWDAEVEAEVLRLLSSSQN